jgi:hypothetical protein
LRLCIFPFQPKSKSTLNLFLAIRTLGKVCRTDNNTEVFFKNGFSEKDKECAATVAEFYFHQPPKSGLCLCSSLGGNQKKARGFCNNDFGSNNIGRKDFM